MRENTYQEIEKFLREVDEFFPVPLSHKQDLKSFANKIVDLATVCLEHDEDRIIGMVVGYTDNVIDNRAYISVVATAKDFQGRGIATKLIEKFMNICKEKCLDSVHLYTDKSNKQAIELYKKIGFSEWKVENEIRPEDIHLIYYFK